MFYDPFRWRKKLVLANESHPHPVGAGPCGHFPSYLDSWLRTATSEQGVKQIQIADITS